MTEGIQVVVGAKTDDGYPLMEFVVYEEGANLGFTPSRDDLEFGIALFRDLADMLEHKLRLMTN